MKNNLKKILITVITLIAFLVIFFKVIPPSTQAQITPSEPQYRKDLNELIGNVLRFFSTVRTSTDDPNSTITPNPDLTQPDSPDITIGPIPPPSASKLTRILFWANVLNLKLIANNIVWPPWWYFHKMVSPVSNGGYTGIAGSATSTSNLYWCTFLVIDAFNLSGLRGLTTAHSAVLNMVPFFMRTPGYTFIPYSVAFSTYSPPRYRVTTNAERRQSLAKVQPGCTTFFQSNPGVHERNHVAILKTKVLDSNFNGYIETFDSNNTVRVARYPVRDGNIMNTLYVPDSLRGFGCPI